MPSGSSAAALVEAVAAVDGTVPTGDEWHCCLRATSVADRGEELAGAAGGARPEASREAARGSPSLASAIRAMDPLKRNSAPGIVVGNEVRVALGSPSGAAVGAPNWRPEAALPIECLLVNAECKWRLAVLAGQPLIFGVRPHPLRLPNFVIGCVARDDRQ